jgi:hypothetical protein
MHRSHIALSLSFVALSAIAGCGASASDPSESSSEAVTSCSAPFSTFNDACTMACSPEGVGGKVVCKQTCVSVCEKVTASPAIPPPAPQPGTPVAPANALAGFGCTEGLYVPGLIMGEQTFNANIWACPTKAPLANLPPSFTALPGCSLTALYPCESIILGDQINANYWVGAPLGDWTLVEEATFAPPPSGVPIIGGSCGTGCMQPRY